MTDKDQDQEVENSDEPPPSDAPPPLPELRATSLYGDINEENSRECVYSLLVLGTSNEPMDFYISTGGGTTSDMFSIYDMMRQVRNNCEIRTVGIGRVMSAGVLLLAAGTTGKRKIGKYCRLMIHPAQTDFIGSSNKAKQHIDEIKLIEKLYVEALVEETIMKKKFLQDLIKGDKDFYFNAYDAVKFGIVDEVI
jgi:ATP-dependent Clp protease protease subunit